MIWDNGYRRIYVNKKERAWVWYTQALPQPLNWRSFYTMNRINDKSHQQQHRSSDQDSAAGQESKALTHYGGFFNGLREKAAGIRSQCSHLIRGREADNKNGAKPLPQETKRPKKSGKTQNISPEQPVYETLLGEIQQNQQFRVRLQSYDPKEKELRFACGDGRNSVLVSSKKEVKKAKAALRSRLTREVVRKFLKNPEAVDGKELRNNLQKVLKEYLHFEDERVYLFLSLWITGTYLYSIFSHQYAVPAISTGEPQLFFFGIIRL